VARSVVLVELTVFLACIVGFNVVRRFRSSDPSGRCPIKPVLFRTGKGAMGISWACLFFHALGLNLNLFRVPPVLDYVSGFLVFGGIAFAFPAFLRLGDGSRFGLPREPIEIQTGGIYGISRNPMYLGFYLVTLASLLLVPNPVNVCAGVVGIVLHHRVVLAEERFLLEAYGSSYAAYMRRVRRYL